MIITITNNNDYPMIVEKQLPFVNVKLSKNEIKKGEVVSISSSGKYVVKIIEGEIL